MKLLQNLDCLCHPQLACTESIEVIEDQNSRFCENDFGGLKRVQLLECRINYFI